MLSLASLLTPALIAAPTPQDFSHFGANPERNGRVEPIGPRAAEVLWDVADPSSIIAWFPFVADGAVYTVRESGFPQSGGAANDLILALDLETGAELWRTTLPFGGDTSTEWIAWIAGVRNGIVYASRTSTLQPGPIQALDAATGAPLWTSAWSGDTGAYDGVTFLDGGDFVIGDRNSVARVDGMTGALEWETARTCPVSGNCSAAVFDGGVYIDQAAVGGNRITKLDLATGAELYSSPVLPGFTNQNAPFCGPGGTVYLMRTQNNPAVDQLYAFDDDGTQFVGKWDVDVRWTTSHEHGVGADGSIYTFNPLGEFVRLDPATGAEIGNAGAILPASQNNLSPKTVVDGAGKVYVSNGFGSSPPLDGRLWCFDATLQTEYFELTLDRQNQGGPALGGDGVLVMADRARVVALREPEFGQPVCTAGMPNSSGAEGQVLARGTGDVNENRVLLTARHLPTSVLGYFLVARSLSPTGPPPTNDFCLASPVGRYSQTPKNSGRYGTWSQEIDLNVIPLSTGAVPAMAGDTWYFQGWHRDSGPSGPTTDFTSAVSVTLF